MLKPDFSIEERQTPGSNSIAVFNKETKRNYLCLPPVAGSCIAELNVPDDGCRYAAIERTMTELDGSR